MLDTVLTAAVIARLSSEFEFRMDNELQFQAANFCAPPAGDEADSQLDWADVSASVMASPLVDRADR